MTVRWTFAEWDDPTTTWTYDINPNEGGSPTMPKTIAASANVGPYRRMLLQEGQSGVPTLSFNGIILTRDHYQSFEYWYAKRQLLILTDDLGRTFSGVFSSFSPSRVRKPYNPWYHTYSAEFQIVTYVNATGREVYTKRISVNDPNAPTQEPIGAATNLQVQAATNSAVATWDFASGSGHVSYFQVMYKKGLVAPTGIKDGTKGPVVDVFAVPKVILSGLDDGAQYAVAVIPVGPSGITGTIATKIFSTNDGPDSQAPAPVTNFKVQGDPSMSSIPLRWTRPSDIDYVGATITWRQGNVTAPTTPHGGQGWIDVDANNGDQWTHDALPKGTWFTYSIFARDGAGNYSTPVTLKAQTDAIPNPIYPGGGGRDQGQGYYDLVPNGWSTTYLTGFPVASDGTYHLDDWYIYQNYSRATAGPSHKDNVRVITNPSATRGSALSLIVQRVTNGWFKPGNPTYDSHYRWADGVTSGTGFYAAGCELVGHYFDYGAVEMRVRFNSAALNNAMARIMAYPVRDWPQQEFDLLRLLAWGQGQINMLYDNGTPSGGHSWNQFNWDLTQWTVLTLVKTKPVTADLNPRVQVFWNGQCLYDTKPPYIPLYNTNAINPSKVGYLLTPHVPSKIVLNLDYQGCHYDATKDRVSGATFAATQGPGATQRLPLDLWIDTLQIWNQP